MSVKLILKNSKVQFKNATSAQLANAELAINFHESGPYLQAKGDDGTVHAMGGVYIEDEAPSNPLPGRWWYNSGSEQLFLYDGSTWKEVGGGGGGGGTTTVIGGDGIKATTSGSTVTVSVDLATDSNGLSIASNQLQADLATESSAGTVIVGDGLSIDALGVLSADGGGAGDLNPLAGRALTYNGGTTPETLNADIATASAVGVVSVGSGIDVDAAGEISVTFPEETFIGENPPESPVAGDLWWNSSDDSGRLYVYYDEGPGGSKQWVEASPQGDTLTESDADTLYLSKVSDDTAEGEITFEKLTTHEGGVSVTGGVFNAASTNQIVSHSGGLAITGGGSEHYLGLFDGGLYSAGKLDRAGTVAGGLISNLTYGSNATSVFTFSDRCNYAAVGDVVKSSFRAFPQGLTFTAADTEKYMAFYANVAADTTSGKNLAWSFYAEGTAPNYFAGLTEVENAFRVYPNGGAGSSLGDNTLNVGGLTLGSYLTVKRVSSGTTSVGALFIAKTTGGTNPADTVQRITTFTATNGTDTIDGHIQTDGSGGIELANTSDYRTKENIVDLPSAVDEIKALRPVNFNYIWAPGRTRPGFIAHELSDVLPVAATGTKDETEAIGTLADYDGTVIETEVTEPSAEELEYTEETTDDEGVTTQAIRTRTWTATGTRPVYQGVDQTKLIPLLTKALQEALERIEALEAAAAG